jgi:hypothetical protein
MGVLEKVSTVGPLFLYEVTDMPQPRRSKRLRVCDDGDTRLRETMTDVFYLPSKRGDAEE